MFNFESVDKRVERFNSYLDKLYFAGRLKLSELQSFRKLLDDISQMFSTIKSLSVFGVVPWYAKKDIDKLNSELTLMEYNVSLITANAVCGV